MRYRTLALVFGFVITGANLRPILCDGAVATARDTESHALFVE